MSENNSKSGFYIVFIRNLAIATLALKNKRFIFNVWTFSLMFLLSPIQLMAREAQTLPDFYYLENVEGTREMVWVYACHSHPTISAKSVMRNAPFPKNFSALKLNCSHVVEIERLRLQQFVVELTRELESRKDKVYVSDGKMAAGSIGVLLSFSSLTASMIGLYEMMNRAESVFSFKEAKRFTMGSAFVTAVLVTVSVGLLLSSSEKERETYEASQRLQVQIDQGVIGGHENVDRQILQRFGDFLSEFGKVVHIEANSK